MNEHSILAMIHTSVDIIEENASTTVENNERTIGLMCSRLIICHIYSDII